MLCRAFFVFCVLLFADLARSAPPELRSGRFATSDGVRLHYLEAGRGPLMVFVPGWIVPGWVWEPQLQHFAATHRVVAFDPRAQGESEPVTEGLYTARRAKDIAELLAHVQGGPALLIGHSMAVGELLSYVAQFGTKALAGLVLVDAALGPDDPAQLVEFARLFQRDRQGFIEQNRAMYYKRPPPAAYWSRLVADVLKVPNATAIALLVGSAGMDGWAVLPRIDRPVLYAITPQFKEEAATLRAALPQSRVELFEDSAHVLFVDEPEKFNRILGEFARKAFAR